MAWQRVAEIAGKAGLILLALIVVGLIAMLLTGNRDGLRRLRDRLAAKQPLA